MWRYDLSKTKKITEIQMIFFCFLLGQDFIGITRCAEGLTCYSRTKWYAHCAKSCPGADWAC